MRSPPRYAGDGGFPGSAGGRQRTEGDHLGVGRRDLAEQDHRRRHDRSSATGPARLLTELHFAAPERVGLLHADPHPGNYMLTDDGRLAVIDFGSVARLPDGAPPIIGRVTRLALDGRADDVLEALRAEGFVPADYDPDPSS